MKVQAYGETLTVVTARYQASNGLAVQVVDATGCPFGTVSVNLPESKALPEGAFYVKHWAENEPLVDALISQGVIEPVDAPVAASGFISGIKAYRLRG